MPHFWLVDHESTKIVKEFTSNTAREAALKAATRDVNMICLVEVSNGKLHVFRGSRIPLSDAEQNNYTRSRNISSKPHVSKLGYRNLKKTCTRQTIDEICREFVNMVS